MLTFIQYGTYNIYPRPVFQCEFHGGVRFVISLTIFGNFFVLHVCTCAIHHFECEFNGDVHFVIRLTIVISLFYMYVYALYTFFQCEFNCNSDYVIWTLHFENI